MTYSPQLEWHGDKRIAWCRENIPGFKACHDQAEAARKSVEENRLKMAPAMEKTNGRVRNLREIGSAS